MLKNRLSAILLVVIIIQAFFITYYKIKYNKSSNEARIAYTGLLGNLSSILLIYERQSERDCEDAKALTEMFIKDCVDRLSDKDSIIDPLEDTKSQLSEAYQIAVKFTKSYPYSK
jgi:hypothetical protein